MSKSLDAYTDGACSGNPGLAAIGVVLKEKGKTIKEIARVIGQATNNIAEYTAFICALQEGLILKADRLTMHTDSELLYHQVKGNYKVKNENLKPLFAQIQHLVEGFKTIEIKHIPREENHEADRLASRILKKEQAKMVAPMFNTGEESPSSNG